MSSCLSASGNGSTQTRHLAPRCSPPIGRPHPDGQYCSTIKTLVFTLHRRHRYSCSGPDASKGAWKLGGGYAGLQPQIKLSLVGRKKWGRSPLTGRHQLLYFSSFLTSACADPCRCPFFSILFFPPPDTETGSQIQSNHQAAFLSLRGLLRLIVGEALESNGDTHTHIHPGCLHSVPLQVRGPSAWPLSWGPPFPVRLQPSIQLQSQHQPDATGPLAGKGSASDTHLSLVERQEWQGGK